MNIAIIGGGIAGSSVAIYLGTLGYNVTLFEKKSSLVDGPPMCHLHAGGNLYPDISMKQCIRLLRESIDLIKLYPQSIDYRPTLITIPKYDDNNPVDLLKKLNGLKLEYEKLIKEDITNKLIGEPCDYYKAYSKDDVVKILNTEYDKLDKIDKWIYPFAKEGNLEKIKYPIFLVQEYGLNVFRVAASATLLLEKIENASVKLNCDIQDIKKDGSKYIVKYINDSDTKVEEFDYLINAAGFESGKIDDAIGKKRDRFIEFKAAYVTKWSENIYKWPEVIFFGKRGSSKGMRQFTPYYDNYFQIHTMTNDVTLFDNGLVSNKNNTSNPQLKDEFLDRINKSWIWSEVEDRTKKSITYVSEFINGFKSSTVASKPLYGIQQIPGNDENLRASEVSFDGEDYARCEIVKASSVLAMAEDIIKKIPLKKKIKLDHDFFNLNAKSVDKKASELAENRAYPKKMGFLYNNNINEQN